MKNNEKSISVISRLLIEYRTRYHLTQHALGKLLNCSQVDVSNYEKGRYLPRLIVVEKIAELYKTTVSELYKDSFLDGVRYLAPIKQLKVSLEEATLEQILQELMTRKVFTHITFTKEE